MLIYGPPGGGKTTLAASSADIPEMRDILLLSIESGDMSILDNERILNPGLIMEVPLTNFGAVDVVKDWLVAHCTFRDQNNLEKLAMLEERVTGVKPTTPKKFQTVILDSLSELDNLSLQGILGITEHMSLDSDMPSAEWTHYKQNNSRMQMLVRQLRNLPMNVIMTSHSKYVQDEQKKMHFSPALTGQLKDQVQGFVDVVGFLTSSTPTEDAPAPRRLYVQPINKIDAKNRWSSYKKAYFEDPTMTTILQAVGVLPKATPAKPVTSSATK